MMLQLHRPHALGVSEELSMTPSDEQIRQYCDKLPQIYKDVLSSFPEINSARREGDQLTEQSIVEHLIGEDNDYLQLEITDAVEQLTGKGFLTSNPYDVPSRSGIRTVRPTIIGERLISSITGKSARPSKIPELPVPTWG
jgi:hypothetical protein